MVLRGLEQQLGTETGATQTEQVVILLVWKLQRAYKHISALRARSPSPRSGDGGVRLYIPPAPFEYACKTTCEIIFVASTYLSVHFPRHCASELDIVDDGFVTHFWKHLSRTVVKNSCAYAFASSAFTCDITISGFCSCAISPVRRPAPARASPSTVRGGVRHHGHEPRRPAMRATRRRARPSSPWADARDTEDIDDALALLNAQTATLDDAPRAELASAAPRRRA